MYKRTMNFAAAAFALLLSALPAAAGQQPSIDVKAAAGYRYDSNVSLSELDTNTGESDNALLLELGLAGSVPLSERITAKLAYGYTQTAYRDFSEFDTTIHRLQGDLQWRAGGFNTGLSLRHFAARLDGDGFLDIRQVSPYIARLFANRIYLRGAYTNSRKSYADNKARDADNNAFDVDAYWLLDGMQRYVALGYRLDSEDASAAEFDYDGNRVKLTYGHALKRVQLKARLQLQQRKYLGINETIGIERNDDRLRASVSALVPFTESISLEGEARYADYRSNLESANFDEMIYSVNLAATF